MAFPGASISRSRFRAIQRAGVDRPTPRFSANSRRVRPLVRARRTASSSDSCANPFCFVIEFTFHPRKTLHFFEASPNDFEPEFAEFMHQPWCHRSGLDPYAGVIPCMTADQNGDLFWNRGALTPLGNVQSSKTDHL